MSSYSGTRTSFFSNPSFRSPPRSTARQGSRSGSPITIQTRPKTRWNGIEVEQISDNGTIDDIVVMGKELGKGAFGAVRQGMYQGKQVAVKKQLVTQKMTNQLVKEIKALKLARDSGCGQFINEIYDVVLDNRRSEVYFIMELLDGKELKKYVDEMPKGELLSEEQIMKIITPLKLGLDCLHKSGIAHRDVKPGNVMLDGNGSAKWIDLGLSCIQSCGSGVAGTPSTIAPEVVAHVRDWDIHSWMITDMWSFGCLIYYIAMRRHVPFQSKIADLITVKKFNEIRDIVDQNMNTKVNAKTNYKSINNIIDCCLVVNPSERETEWKRIQYDSQTGTLFVEGASLEEDPAPAVPFKVSNVLSNLLDAFDGKTASNVKPRPPHGFVNKFVFIKDRLFYETDQGVLGAQYQDATTMLMNKIGTVNFIKTRRDTSEFDKSKVPKDLKRKFDILIDSQTTLANAVPLFLTNPDKVTQTFDVHVAHAQSESEFDLFRMNTSDLQIIFKNGVSVILSDEGRSATFIFEGLKETNLSSKLAKSQPKYMEFIRDMLLKLKSKQDSKATAATVK